MESNIMVGMFNTLIVYLIVFLVIILGIYVAQAIFLNKFNKLVNGKGTPMAWIPIANVYLLGKLTINKIVGWALIVCIFLTGKYTVTVNGNETSGTILPENVGQVVSLIYSIVVVVLFIYAIIKYNKLKKQMKVTVEQNQSELKQVNEQPIMEQQEVNSVDEQTKEQAIIEQPEVKQVDGQVNEQPINEQTTLNNEENINQQSVSSNSSSSNETVTQESIDELFSEVDAYNAVNSEESNNNIE